MLKDFVLGTNIFERMIAVFFRIFGCNHPDNITADLGDEDRGPYWFCFRCQKQV